jgi:ABC-type multidrug transport system fused ATPase/permease subunit
MVKNTEMVGGNMPVPSPFDSFIMAINANPYFIGFMMLMLNLGGRFIGLELTKSQETFLQNVWVRRALIFIVLFMGTRNVLVAFWMWLAVVFLLGYVLNENSSMCIFGGVSGVAGSKCASTGGANKEGFQQPKLTPEEAEILNKLKAKAGESPLPNSSSPVATQAQQEQEEKQDEVDTYLENMNMIRSMNDNPRF